MSNLNDVDLSEGTPLSEGFTAIPAGDYALYIEASERKPFGNPPQDKLEIVFVVTNGEHEGAKIREWFALWEPDAEKRGRAKGRFQALCEATLRQPHAINNDSTSLHGKVFMANVLNEPQWDKATNAPDPSKRTNKISWKKGTIRAMDGTPAAGGNAAPQQQQAQPTQNAGVAQQQTAPVQQQAAVVPGQGKAPWKR